MATEFFTAILLNSKDPETLARFYIDIMEIPLEVADHGGPKHYEAQLGDLHFAIRPVRGEAVAGTGAVDIGLQIFDLNGFLKRLETKGIEPLNPPADRGFARMTGIKDPDGNMIWLTELTDTWLTYMQDRRAKGADIYAKWKSQKT